MDFTEHQQNQHQHQHQRILPTLYHINVSASAFLVESQNRYKYTIGLFDSP